MPKGAAALALAPPVATPDPEEQPNRLAPSAPRESPSSVRRDSSRASSLLGRATDKRLGLAQGGGFFTGRVLFLGPGHADSNEQRPGQVRGVPRFEARP